MAKSPPPTTRPPTTRPPTTRPSTTRPATTRPATNRPPPGRADELLARSGHAPRRTAAPVQQEAAGTGPVRDLYAPLLLLALGLAGRGAELLGAGGGSSGRSVGLAVGLLAFETVIAVAAVAAGVLAVASWMGSEVGAPRTAALKAVATAVFLSALGYAAASVDTTPDSPNGIIAAWHVVVLGYFICYAALFRMDLAEALAATAITALLQLGLLALVAAGLTADQARALFFGG